MDDELTPIDVSVVIPVRDMAGTIGIQLDALARQQTGCRWELLIADNGSTDGTAEVARRHPVCAIVPTTVLDAGTKPSFNTPRNVGVHAARGRIVLLLDADDEARPDWIEQHWRSLRDAPASVCAGPLDIERLNPPRLRPWGLGLSDPLGFSTKFGTGWGANMGFHREVWEAVGGFDPSYGRGFNEIDFFAKVHTAGFGFRWVEGAVVDYRLSPHRLRNLAKAAQHGYSLPHFSAQHPTLVSRPRFAVALRTAVAMATHLPAAAWRRDGRAPRLLRSIAYQTGVLAALTVDRWRGLSRPRQAEAPTH